MLVEIKINKKIILLFFTLIVTIAFCGCDSYVADDNNSETVVTTKNTEATQTINTTVAETTAVATEEQTAEVVETSELVSTTVAEITTEEVNEIEDENRISFGDYSLILPENWTYVQKDGYYSFYEKTIYEETQYGNLFAIKKYENALEIEVSGCYLIGEHNGYYYYRGGPTSPDTDTSNERLLNLWLTAYNQADDVIATLEWNN